MANANITPIQLTNTFDEWRVATNDLVQDRNTLRNAVYVKDESDFQIANGAMVISRSTGGTLLTVSGTGSALVGGTTTTTDLIVGDDASVANQLTVTGNTIIGGTLNVNAKIYSYNANGDFIVTTGNLYIGANSTLNSNVSVNNNTYISQNAYITGDLKVNTNKFIAYADTGNTVVYGDLTVSGGDIIANTSNLNVFNAFVETMYVANFANSITMGNTTSLITLRGDLDVIGGDITSTATANVVNTSATEVNFAGAATLTRVGSNSGTVNVRNNLTVTNDLTVLGGDIVSTAIANVVNTTTTTLNLGGAATTLNMGALSGTVNVAGDLLVTGGDITSTAIANLLNTTTTTLNLGGAATTVEIGAATGTTNINNNLDVDGDVNIDGGDLTVSTTTFNLANSVATTVNFAGSATALNLGGSAGTTDVKNDLNVTGLLDVDSGILTGPATFNIGNTSITAINLGGGAATVRVGSTTGTTIARNDLTVTNDLEVSGGDITGPATFNLANTSATALNLGGVAGIVRLGSTNGTVNVRNQLLVAANANVAGNLHMSDNVYIPQGKNLFSYFIQTSATENDLFIERGNGVFRNVEVKGTFSLSSPAVLTANSIIINEMPSVARNGMFIVRRGSPSSNAFLQWNEVSAVWRAASSDASIATLLTTSNITDSVTSTSVINAAAPNSVKTVYDTTIAAYGQANTARTQANNAYGQANLAYGQANNAYSQANAAFTAANNAVSGTAGPAYTQANNAYTQANAAYVQANNAYGQANLAYGQANSAFTAANNRVSSVSGTAGRITSSGGLTPTIDLATAGPGAGSYSGGIGAISLDAYGRVSGVTSGGITANNILENVSVGGSTTLSTGQTYVVTSSGQTITLPASPSTGMYVRISVGNFINTTIARNGTNIMGLAENLTIDVAYAGITLIYSGATYGWRVL